MSDFVEMQLTPEREENLTAVLLEGLWDDYCRTDDLDFLILFIRRGGDISDQNTRNIIADLLENPPENPGGSISMENIRFYNHVRMLMDIDRMGKTKAVEYVAKLEGISTSGGWTRFNAGEKLSDS